MSLDANMLAERNNIKRSLTKWKIAFVIALISIFLIFKSDNNLEKAVNSSALPGDSAYIASININGFIGQNSERDEILKELRENDSAKAVIVNINSGGGSITGSEMLYDQLLRIKAKKPVVVVMGEMAASGGYMAALASDHIIAYNSTITGSIGTIITAPEISELAEKIGVKINNIKSDPLKAVPSPTERLTSEGKEATMDVVLDGYEYFLSLVAKHRKIPLRNLRNIADGKIYTGRQALKYKLIDQIGTSEDAPKWLEKNKDIDPNLKIKEVSLRKKNIIEEYVPNIFTSWFSRVKSNSGAMFAIYE